MKKQSKIIWAVVVAVAIVGLGIYLSSGSALFQGRLMRAVEPQVVVRLSSDAVPNIQYNDQDMARLKKGEKIIFQASIKASQPYDVLHINPWKYDESHLNCIRSINADEDSLKCTLLTQAESSVSYEAKLGFKKDIKKTFGSNLIWVKTLVPDELQDFDVDETVMTWPMESDALPDVDVDESESVDEADELPDFDVDESDSADEAELRV